MEEAKITSVERADQREAHVKDPKRVEAGKRLAAMSKQAKDKKAVERLSQKMSIDEFQIPSVGSVNPLALVGVVGVVGAVVYYKYFYKESESQKFEDMEGSSETSQLQGDTSETLDPPPKQSERSEKPKRRELDTLD